MKAKHLASISGISSIFGNILLAGFKIYVALISNSSAIMADAWHTLSDSLTSVIFLVGLKISGRKPDSEHPFGHGRAELVSALIIGVLLAVVALDFTIDGIRRLISRSAAEYGILAYVAMILTIVIKEGMAQFAFYAARRNRNLTSLKADGVHHRTDALSSLVILIGLFVGSNFWWLDGVLSIFVSLMIFYSSIEVLRGAVNPLLGEPADAALIDKITALCLLEAGQNVEAHHFHLHCYGEHRELTFHIRLPAEWTLKTAHAKTENIQQQIKQNLNIEATVHAEPAERQL